MLLERQFDHDKHRAMKYTIIWTNPFSFNAMKNTALSHQIKILDIAMGFFTVLLIYMWKMENAG